MSRGAPSLAEIGLVRDFRRRRDRSGPEPGRHRARRHAQARSPETGSPLSRSLAISRPSSSKRCTQQAGSPPRSLLSDIGSMVADPGAHGQAHHQVGTDGGSHGLMTPPTDGFRRIDTVDADPTPSPGAQRRGDQGQEGRHRRWGIGHGPGAAEMFAARGARSPSSTSRRRPAPRWPGAGRHVPPDRRHRLRGAEVVLAEAVDGARWAPHRGQHRWRRRRDAHPRPRRARTRSRTSAA